MSYGSTFVLTLFTASPVLARLADAAGVDRIGIDLETLGKRSRQGHTQTWISDHKMEDLAAIGSSLSRAKLFARCNPIHKDSKWEIDRLIACGATVIMLPYFKTGAEVEQFLLLLDNRAYPVLLVETVEAAAIIPELCRIPGVREIHFGLNDLRLSLGWPSHFHVLTSDLLARLASEVLSADLKLGIGGLGRSGDNRLPIPADLVAAQMPRLHATAALIARSFFQTSPPENLHGEIQRLRASLDTFAAMPAEWLAHKRAELASLAQQRFLRASTGHAPVQDLA